MNRAARDHADEVAKRIPACRVGTDEDMAGVAIYLASRAGDYVVGNTIAVDGGVVYASAGVKLRGRSPVAIPANAAIKCDGWNNPVPPRRWAPSPALAE